MARGWESKSVEDQISEREAEMQVSRKSALSSSEKELLLKREGLLLARARTLSGLQSACGGRYRAQLEAALAHLDRQLAELK